MSQRWSDMIASLTFVDGLVLVLLTITVLAVVVSWILWRTPNAFDQLVAGVVLCAAMGGLVGVFHGGVALGMFLGADVGWACVLIWYVLSH
jgi:hypothetical protein